jgi:pSer/pThr/pTyr-binding forkhead associated (FHA) protein
MPLFLEIKTGARIGQKFPIHEGTRVGRTTGEILIPDSKISSLHAQIERDEAGALVLKDRGSANGILINDQKVTSIALMPGVLFRLGKTSILVTEEAGPIQISSPSSNAEQRVEWKNTLLQMIPDLLAQNSSKAMALLPFSPPLCLKFTSGIQIDEGLVLGYGPRKFGSSVLDIELKDPVAPQVAFEITPEQNFIKFSTKEPRIVQVNGRQVPSLMLREGDVISFGETQIVVSTLASED